MTTTPAFIGYADLTNLCVLMTRTRPLYTMLITEVAPGPHQIHTEKMAIRCSQIDLEGHIHYCHIPVASVRYMGPTSLIDNPEQRRTWAKQAWDIVTNWLWEQDFDIREAVVAMPREYRFLDGRAPFLAFDKETGFYRRETGT